VRKRHKEGVRILWSVEDSKEFFSGRAVRGILYSSAQRISSWVGPHPGLEHGRPQANFWTRSSQFAPKHAFPSPPRYFKGWSVINIKDKKK
jgi:hypothetical protein